MYCVLLRNLCSGTKRVGFDIYSAAYSLVVFFFFFSFFGSFCNFSEGFHPKWSYSSYLVRASLIAQLVKNPPAMQETPVQFLGQEDPPDKA